MSIKYIHIYSDGSLCENNEIIPLVSCLFCFGLVVDVVGAVVVATVVVHFVVGQGERVAGGSAYSTAPLHNGGYTYTNMCAPSIMPCFYKERKESTMSNCVNLNEKV